MRESREEVMTSWMEGITGQPRFMVTAGTEQHLTAWGFARRTINALTLGYPMRLSSPNYRPGPLARARRQTPA